MIANPYTETSATPAQAETHWKLETFERALRKTARGAKIADAIAAHIEEILYLVNHNRRVAVTWRRNQGPAFVIAFRDSLNRDGMPIPKTVNGVQLERLLLRMADALQRSGSLELRRMIADSSLQALTWARECGSVNALFEEFESTTP